jgi:DNA-binding XRE family transcriptional regulator
MRNSLRIYLERRCINIAELARRADIPKTTIYSVAAEKASAWNMTLTTARKLAGALGVSVDDLCRELEEIEASGNDA